MSAPYTLIGPLTRGNLPEVIALALMPLILLLFRRLILLRQTRYFAASILAYAALCLTHNISSLLFTPLLLVYVAIVAWVKARDAIDPLVAYGVSPIANRRLTMRNTQHAIRNTLRAIAPSLLALALTLGLTAFFWLPALTEQDQVQLYLTHAARGNDYHFNFISLAELLGGPGSADPKLLNPPLRIFFGWPQLVLAALGVLAYRRSIPDGLKARVQAGVSGASNRKIGPERSRRDAVAEPTQSGREQRVTIIAAAIAVIALTFMALPASLPLWDNLPLIRFVQFPWRFVGRAMLPAALLAAAAVISPQRTQRTQSIERNDSALFASFAVKHVLFGAAIFAALLFTAPLSYPRTCSTPHELDINAVFAYERASGHIGVDPLGAYLPRTVIERPAGSPLEAQYA
ncbi:MAG: hypothetical protein ACREU7_14275, partial [Burkholderiales bacterium]